MKISSDEILQRLYEDNIRFSILCLGDDVIEIGISYLALIENHDAHCDYCEDCDVNDWSNYETEIEKFEDFESGIKWLVDNAVKFYPDSEFAKWWRKENENK